MLDPAIYRVEQVFLVHAATGPLLGKASPPDVATPDADIVSAVLTAIRDFAGDSFDASNAERSAGGLLSFSVGELTMLVEPGPRALLAAVLRGQPTVELRRKLTKTIEDVHALFGSALARFDGDSAPFRSTVPLIERCLVTALETNPAPRSAPVNWRPALIGVALLLIVGVTWSVRSASGWRTAMRALEATPGLLVVASERSLGTSTIRGLPGPIRLGTRRFGSREHESQPNRLHLLQLAQRCFQLPALGDVVNAPDPASISPLMRYGWDACSRMRPSLKVSSLKLCASGRHPEVLPELTDQQIVHGIIAHNSS